MKKTLCLGIALLTTAAAFAQQEFGPGTGGPLFDATANGHSGSTGFTWSIINVNAPGQTIVSLNSITITGLNHTNLGDLSFDLMHIPSGAFVTFHDVDGFSTTNLNGTYTFVVSSSLPTLIQAAGNAGPNGTVPSGTYASADESGRNNFSDFAGVNASGNWQLGITDWLQGGTGSFTGWSFNATVTPVPEPASMAALGLGALALVRHRRPRLR